MNFIKKVFDGKIDDSVHLQFQKFSKGEFRNRALILGKKGTGKYTITTSAEFANGLVRLVAGRLGETRTKITGAVVSTLDLKELNYKEKKQFQGVKRYIIDAEMSGKEILNLLDNFPKAFFALSFEAGENKLKIKAKAPKSGKPGKGDEEPKPDFCKLVTTDRAIAEDFVFENPEFRSASINHTFLINEIVIPDELKQEKDFSIIREKARRKGRIIRNATIDGNVLKEERGFEA